MRTAIFLLALAVGDVAKAIKKGDAIPNRNILAFYAILFFAFLVMDIVDFLR